jgi:hypothetical protein
MEDIGYEIMKTVKKSLGYRIHYEEPVCEVFKKKKLITCYMIT